MKAMKAKNTNPYVYAYARVRMAGHRCVSGGRRLLMCTRTRARGWLQASTEDTETYPCTRTRALKMAAQATQSGRDDVGPEKGAARAQTKHESATLLSSDIMSRHCCADNLYSDLPSMVSQRSATQTKLPCTYCAEELLHLLIHISERADCIGCASH